VKYQDLFDKAEKEAGEANRGLWGSCGLVAGTNTTAPATDCVIKGNISSSGEKIYHLPGQRYYNQTVISESKGERWFCTEEEAQKAGWRKSKV
jgi:micrococcal nuclease